MSFFISLFMSPLFLPHVICLVVCAFCSLCLYVVSSFVMSLVPSFGISLFLSSFRYVCMSLFVIFLFMCLSRSSVRYFFLYVFRSVVFSLFSYCCISLSIPSVVPSVRYFVIYCVCLYFVIRSVFRYFVISCVRDFFLSVFSYVYVSVMYYFCSCDRSFCLYVCISLFMYVVCSLVSYLFVCS